MLIELERGPLLDLDDSAYYMNLRICKEDCDVDAPLEGEFGWCTTADENGIYDFERLLSEQILINMEIRRKKEKRHAIEREFNRLISVINQDMKPEDAQAIISMMEEGKYLKKGINDLNNPPF